LVGAVSLLEISGNSFIFEDSGMVVIVVRFEDYGHRA
jgi:hypothetical protein